MLRLYLEKLELDELRICAQAADSCKRPEGFVVAAFVDQPVIDK
jgi:hypothetical protein